jgi:hypothetical protein
MRRVGKGLYRLSERQGREGDGLFIMNGWASAFSLLWRHICTL